MSNKDTLVKLKCRLYLYATLHKIKNAKEKYNNVTNNSQHALMMGAGDGSR